MPVSKKQVESHAKALLREANALAREADALTKRAVALIDLVNQPDPSRSKPMALVLARVKPLPLDERTVRNRGWRMALCRHQRLRAMAMRRLLLRELGRLSGTMARMLEPVQPTRTMKTNQQISLLAPSYS